MLRAEHGRVQQSRRSHGQDDPNYCRTVLADDGGELEQIASDPLRAPPPVLARDSRVQLPYLGTEFRTSTSRAGLPTPEQAPALPMPAHNGGGRDEGQMLAPAGAELASEDPQQFVREAKQSLRSASSRTGEHRELMA